MIAVVTVVTEVLVTVKLAVVDPAGTVTLAGTMAAPLLLLSDTTPPPDGAGPLRVTTPCELLTPVTLFGFTVNEATVTGAVDDATDTLGSTEAYFRTTT